jgi:hypothetical protein
VVVLPGRGYGVKTKNVLLFSFEIEINDSLLNVIIPMSRKRKSVSYKEPPTDPSENDMDEFCFKSSTSKFNYVEEQALKINIVPKKNFMELVGEDIGGLLEEDVPDSVKDLYLEDVTPKKILIFDPDEYPELNDTVSSFLVKLSLVLLNNAHTNDVPREEKLIDDMAVELMKAVKYDDGRDLTMRSCSLRLQIGDRIFAAEADREGRRGIGIIWVMQENKHIDDTRYSGGDVQLISCMIAACQANQRTVRKSDRPERMIGIKVKGDQMFFYSFCMKDSYLKDLTKGLPGEDLEVFKYPDEEGLHISVPEQRKQILSHLWNMRQYALKLRKVKFL